LKLKFQTVAEKTVYLLLYLFIGIFADYKYVMMIRMFHKAMVRIQVNHNKSPQV